MSTAEENCHVVLVGEIIWIARSTIWRNNLWGKLRVLQRAAQTKVLPTKLLQMVLLAFAVPLSVVGIADESYDAAEYQVKAVFLSKFCLYVDWPPGAFATVDSPIVLGIAGPDPVTQLLERLVKDRTINNRPLQVQRIDNNSSLKGVHLLFITRSEQAHFAHLAAQARGQPLLLVTESSSDPGDGSAINFATQDNRVRFDVDLNAIERQGLHLSAQLLKVARAVRGEAAL